jgi:hypothetical protein
MNDERLDFLLNRHLDGQLTPAEHTELEDILRRSAAARRQFWGETRLHGLLHAAENADCAADSSTTTSTPAAHPAPWRRFRRAIPIPLAGLAAACVLLAALALWPRLHSVPHAESTTAAVALLAQAVDVKWRTPGSAPEGGSTLSPGWLRLESGLAEVEFFSGARLILEGPAELQLISPLEAFCAQGRLRGEVPAQARRFTVATPHTRVADGAAEFGLEVGGDATEVHVFSGSVSAGHPGAGPRELHAPAATRIALAGAPESVSADSTRFAQNRLLASRSRDARRLQLERWRDAGSASNLAPALVVRFDFEPPVPGARRLPNVATGPAHGDGIIVGAGWTEGRWPGKSALEFRGVGDRVRLNVPGEFRSITLATWVRVDSIERSFNSLFMCEGFSQGGFHWQISRQGELCLGVKADNQRRFTDYASPPLFGPDRLGQWVHLVVVYDGDARRVTHYLDGEPVGVRPLIFDTPLQIGNADLGNWSLGSWSSIYPVRHFSGLMDEFTLFGRAMPEDEIRRLAEQGRPTARTFAARPPPAAEETDPLRQRSD